MPTGLIAAIASHSLAERVGLQAGDELLSINARPLRDVIDVQFYAAEERLTLQVRRQGRGEFTIRAERRYDEPLGLEFGQPTFDGIRTCTNHCEFCFVAQMPPHLRRSLYIKDDDYRYSFLFGSYVTLTGLDEADWQRIGEQHLSPLYVSVQATDLDLRRRILGRSNAPDVMAQLRRLVDLDIEIHTQIVVIPGLNDGGHLDRSIGDLVELYPGVRSVSVVPVGLTRFHRGDCRLHTDAEIRAVFQQVSEWQARLCAQLGASFVYLSDEWYLRLGEDVPSLNDYDGLDLTENGVGLTRQFLESVGRGVESRIASHESRTLVTGVLFAPILQRATAELVNVDVVPVMNRFFGETVTVAGLLTGQDVVAQLQERDLGDVVVLPPVMFGGPEGQSLDEVWPQAIGEALEREVAVGWA
jgi:putative radical SAM enzyme (TIGR03279 family)